MATYDNLPVYKASYDLLVILFQFTKDFNREYKYTVGESIKKEILEMLTNIYRANGAIDERAKYIQRARENIEAVRLFIRIIFWRPRCR